MSQSKITFQMKKIGHNSVLKKFWKKIKDKEEMIKEKKSLIQEILNSVKTNKAELEELKKQLEHIQEQEMNQGLDELFGPKTSPK
jgi:chromosome segregation ATPase